MVSAPHPGDYASLSSNLYDDVFQTIADIKKKESDRRIAGMICRLLHGGKHGAMGRHSQLMI